MPPRLIISHQVGPVNDRLTIAAYDIATAGGACYRYHLTAPGSTGVDCLLTFQHSDPAGGIDGITNEALLAIVIDRLGSFQAGQFACRENAIAITKLQESLMWLQARTHQRMAAGVAGRAVPLPSSAHNAPASPVMTDGYPADWPRCPGCGKAVLDGHRTCGNVACGEGGLR